MTVHREITSKISVKNILSKAKSFIMIPAFLLEGEHVNAREFLWNKIKLKMENLKFETCFMTKKGKYVIKTDDTDTVDTLRNIAGAYRFRSWISSNIKLC